MDLSHKLKRVTRLCVSGCAHFLDRAILTSDFISCMSFLFTSPYFTSVRDLCRSGSFACFHLLLEHICLKLFKDDLNEHAGKSEKILQLLILHRLMP